MVAPCQEQQQNDVQNLDAKSSKIQENKTLAISETVEKDKIHMESPYEKSSKLNFDENIKIIEQNSEDFCKNGQRLPLVAPNVQLLPLLLVQLSQTSLRPASISMPNLVSPFQGRQQMGS